MNILVGTAGFSYKDWEGIVYPADLKARKVPPLQYLAQFYDCVEINTSFYGPLRPSIGKQWRAWQAPDGRRIDQVKDLLDQLRKNPSSRRLVVSAWNPADVAQMALPPCHCLFQFYVARGRLSCQLYQRSADIFLGVPFNIASYALLTMMVAQVTGLKPGEFVHTFGDAHLYLNHLEQAHLQLSRAPKALPALHINPAVKDIFAFRYEDFVLEGYEPYPHIKATVAV